MAVAFRDALCFANCSETDYTDLHEGVDLFGGTLLAYDSETLVQQFDRGLGSDCPRSSAKEIGKDASAAYGRRSLASTSFADGSDSGQAWSKQVLQVESIKVERQVTVETTCSAEGSDFTQSWSRQVSAVSANTVESRVWSREVSFRVERSVIPEVDSKDLYIKGLEALATQQRARIDELERISACQTERASGWRSWQGFAGHAQNISEFFKACIGSSGTTPFQSNVVDLDDCFPDVRQEVEIDLDLLVQKAVRMYSEKPGCSFKEIMLVDTGKPIDIMPDHAAHQCKNTHDAAGISPESPSAPDMEVAKDAPEQHTNSATMSKLGSSLAQSSLQSAIDDDFADEAKDSPMLLTFHDIEETVVGLRKELDASLPEARLHVSSVSEDKVAPPLGTSFLNEGKVHCQEQVAEKDMSEYASQESEDNLRGEEENSDKTEEIASSASDSHVQEPEDDCSELSDSFEKGPSAKQSPCHPVDKSFAISFPQAQRVGVDESFVIAFPQDQTKDGVKPKAPNLIPVGYVDNSEQLSVLSHLEPVTVEGRTFASWNDALSTKLNRSGFDGLGSVFANPPVDAIIGNGSYGFVWLAQSRHTGEQFALKNVVVKRDARVQRAIAQNEFEVVEKLILEPHPNVVLFHWLESFKITAGELFILAMEFCPGGDLQAAVDECVSVSGVYTPPPESLLWFGQIFLAVEHIHTKLNLLIRDLKLANVILSTRQCAKVTDFGFGRLAADAPGGDWTFCLPPCTPGYAAPELLYQQYYSYPVDIYSLGVIAWVMLSGGSRARSHPAPPVRGSMSDLSSFKSDWKLLHAALKDPAETRCPVDPNMLELILLMTRVSQSDRPDVEALRRNTFFCDNVLPLVEYREGCKRPAVESREGCKRHAVGDCERIVKGVDIGSIGTFEVEALDGKVAQQAQEISSHSPAPSDLSFSF
jgi:hypothetical protein